VHYRNGLTLSSEDAQLLYMCRMLSYSLQCVVQFLSVVVVVVVVVVR
jgi:hypothetical protein